MSTIRIGPPTLDAKIQWGNVLDAVTDASAQALGAAVFSKPPSVGGVSGIIKNIRKSVVVEEPQESRAWSLVALCFAQAIDDLRPQTADEEARKAAREALKATQERLTADAYFLDRSFFESPKTLPLYQAMRADFVAAMEKLWPEGQGVGGKLDAAFNSALYRIVAADRHLFADLRTAVNLPGAAAHEHEEDWRAYRAHLIHEFAVKPLFGQEETNVSLAQLYVDPRAIWTEEHEDEEGESFEVNYVVDLRKDMQAWLKRDARTHRIRLIRGGPGSGKSSFAKCFAADLAADDDARPLYIELQRLRGLKDLKTRIVNLFTEKLEHFRSTPLDKTQMSAACPTILIFDGLDEIVLPDQSGAQRVAEDLWRELEELLGDLNTEFDIRARAVVTGRTPIIEAALNDMQGRRLPKSDALEIVGFQKLDADKVDENNKALLAPQLETWWGKYAKACGAGEDMPPILCTAGS